MNTYDDGDLVRCTTVFTDEDGALQDPAEVFFAFRFGKGGAVTTYVYGTDAELVRDSAGTYSVEIDTGGHENTACYHRFYSAGLGQTAAEDVFYIRRSHVV